MVVTVNLHTASQAATSSPPARHPRVSEQFRAHGERFRRSR